MEKIEPGVWQGTYAGRMYRVVRHQGDPWGKVPRQRTFTYHTCGLYRDGVTSLADAEWGAMRTIDDCIAREREATLRCWYRQRFGVTIDESAAAPREQRFRKLDEVFSDPNATRSDIANAEAAFSLISSLSWRYWFHEQFYETIEEAEAAPPDKRAERISKLETLRDHPRTSPEEAEAAKAALARLRGAETDKAA